MTEHGYPEEGAKPERVLVIGGGGHSLCIQESFLDSGYRPEDIGIIDISENSHSLPGIERIGRDEDLPGLARTGWKHAAVGIGSVESTVLRRKLAALIADAGISLLTVIDPSARVSSSARIGEGVFIAKKAVIQPCAIIDQMAIINTGAIIEHDCVVGAFSHVSSGAILLGGVKVGHDTLIGGGSVIRQGISIGNGCIIGVGSTVVCDIPDHSVAYGNPCKVRRKRT